VTLGERQRQFPPMVASLIEFAYANGYALTFGEALRTQAQAEANAKSGSGIVHSLHLLRLAIDLNLFKDGLYLTKTSDHEPLGIYWESIGGTWGGRFSKPDGNHYSLEWQGVK